MAALVAGVQYGLSTQSNFHENKSLIFVKLTDSAQRAIEDFLKNRNKINQNPTIQFSGNEGKLLFPSSQSNHGSAKFTFSLSSNHDIEGPQGSFECVQQTDTKNLESLGALPCKMRIQAKEDVYETTRHRMAVCEENNKNKATRVIKANGPDIGRKVKVKTSGKTITPVNRHREQSSIPTSVNQSSRLSTSSSNSHLYNNFSSSTSLTSSSSSSLSSSLSTTSATSLSTSSSFPNSSSLSNVSLLHGNTSTSTNNYRQTSSNSQIRTNNTDKKLSELVRRPLRERIIHVLALRTYKKPELYDRITREGLRDRDKTSMTTVLKQVAFMRENEYHLCRHVWNDVQEDWPFYTDQDRAMLKRRKPQNLTPPGSSDGGSSGSGQSPNSTHPGSPPAITAPPPPNHKRPGFSIGNDGLQTKRPRISHYRKPDPTSSSSLSSISTCSSYNNNNNNNTTGTTTTTIRDNTRTTNGNGNSNSDNVFKNDFDNQSTTRGHNNHRNNINNNNNNNNRTNNSDIINNRSYGMDKLSLGLISDNEDINQHTKYNNNNNNNNHHQQQQQQQQQSMITGKNDNDNLRTINNIGDVKSNGLTYGNSPNGFNDNNKYDRNIYNNDKIDKAGCNNDRDNRKDKDYGRINNDKDQRRRERDNNNELSNFGASNNTINNDNSYYKNSSSSPSVSSTGLGSVSSSLPSVMSSTSSLTSPLPHVEMIEIPEYPDYRTEFPPIANEEQRLRYKRKFNEDYAEYRQLHTYIAKVPSRFADLEVRRRREGGNQESREAIEKLIIAEYIATKSDRAHIEAKSRFYYLHEKLSHIRNKVDEYDAQNKYADKMNNENKSTINNSEGIMNGGDSRY